MATPKPVGVRWEQPDQSFDGGKPTGNIMFIALPEPTFVAISDVAAKRGITVAQAIGQAIGDFVRKPLP